MLTTEDIIWYENKNLQYCRNVSTTIEDFFAININWNF
jgi:hypothetical protein